jgi:hypothetical protein
MPRCHFEEAASFWRAEIPSVMDYGECLILNFDTFMWSRVLQMNSVID